MHMSKAPDLLLGVDAGTTLLKASVYSPDGICLGNGEAPQGFSNPRPGWVEQQPAVWWEGMCIATHQAMQNAGITGNEIAAIGLSTQGGTIAVFDTDGTLRCPALVWNDERHLTPHDDPQRVEEHRQLTGMPNRNGSPSSLLWLKRNRPDLFIEPYRIGYVPDYLTFRLTGEWISDPTNLGISGICSMADGDIAAEVIGRLGIPRSAFAATIQGGEAAGSLTAEAAEALGLRPGITIASPAHDQYAAALGAGCIHDGDFLLSAGTAWAMVMVTSTPPEIQGSAFWPGRHVEPGKWGLMGSIECGSTTLDTLLSLTQQDKDWDAVNAAVTAIPAGSDGLLILPHLVGRSVPTTDHTARGAILGWALGHNREHLWRAAMESLCLEARAACEYLKSRGVSLSAVRLVGGVARSQLWTTILATILGLPVSACAGENVAVRGAACLASRALGRGDLPILSDWVECAPQPEWQDIYNAAFKRYLESIHRLEN